MKLLSLAFSMLLVLPMSFAHAAPAAAVSDEALDEFEQFTMQMRAYQEAYDRGEVASPLKVQQIDTDAKEVKPEENIADYKAAIGDRYYGYQLFILVNKSVSPVASKGRDRRVMQPQTMYIFARENNDEIVLKDLLPVSTGKEPKPGTVDTREGYMRVQNAQKSYTSRKFGEAMPFSLWFESEYGTAIHQTLQQRCDNLIGHRASAGCIRLCPGDAEKVFNIVTDPAFPRSSAIVLLDKRTGVPVARGTDRPLSRTQIDVNGIYGMPKVIRGYPVMVRIIDGNTPQKAQELQNLLQNPTQGFQQYFKPVSPQVFQSLSM